MRGTNSTDSILYGRTQERKSRSSNHDYYPKVESAWSKYKEKLTIAYNELCQMELSSNNSELKSKYYLKRLGIKRSFPIYSRVALNTTLANPRAWIQFEEELQRKVDSKANPYYNRGLQLALNCHRDLTRRYSIIDLL